MFERILRSGRAGCVALALGCAGFGGAAKADLIPYPTAGSYNPVIYSFTAAVTGNVVAYIVGGFSAGFTNELGLLVNGTPQGGYGLNNKTSSIGDSYNFGSVNAGDTLVFVLNNISLGALAYSDPSLNAGYDSPGNAIGNNHVYSTLYTATSPVFPRVPAGVYVGFEDLPFPGADFNYNDESFVFSNVMVASVPEPSTWALMLLGFVGLAAATRRRASALVLTRART